MEIVAAQISDGATLTASIADLSGARNYVFEVSATNAVGEGARSTPSTTISTSPTAPTTVTSTAQSPTSITLSWSAPVNHGGAAVTSYTVYRSTGVAGSGVTETVPDLMT